MAFVPVAQLALLVLAGCAAGGARAPLPPAEVPAVAAPADTRDTAFERCRKLLVHGERFSAKEPSKTDAVVALGLLGDWRATPLLLEHLVNTEHRLLRRQIIRSLGWLKDPAAVASLETFLQDQDPYLRLAAANALEGITGKSHQFDRTGLPDPSKFLEALRRSRTDGSESESEPRI